MDLCKTRVQGGYAVHYSQVLNSQLSRPQSHLHLASISVKPIAPLGTTHSPKTLPTLALPPSQLSPALPATMLTHKKTWSLQHNIPQNSFKSIICQLSAPTNLPIQPSINSP
ncbi:hypothetical protein PCANC_08694 [Puccinia coronata f. sp. avenae]|uniref:Uncharacterized protein n=1 Tax=Puccinia coronata f. sp. avenae TaxID=200324 RepID=A0A2N5SLR4_9BASI|nr:hypothetical protein PCANC_16986 [Puccinia coronata f. sp. avenae]PLW52846.1 hypothetical protein PCANC_08694 [Puccinia coronata f. sp. avenae]